MNYFSSPKKLFFIRHGQTNWNAGREVVGEKQQSLTDTGRRQIAETAKILNNCEIKFGAVYCSLEERALESSEILIDKLNPELKIRRTGLVNERDYGLEHPKSGTVKLGGGYTPFFYSEFLKLPPDKRWNFKPYTDFESDDEIRTRFYKFLDFIKNETAENIIVVSHGGFIRISLMETGFINYDDWENYAVKNASIHRFNIAGNKIEPESVPV